MVIKITSWTPDTCECQLQYSWDSDAPGDQRTHTFVGASKICDAHKGVRASTYFDTILGESRMKNHTLQQILDSHPEVVALDENENKVLKKGVEYQWRWTGANEDRVLVASLIGNTPTLSEMSVIQDALTTEFGAGKVVLE